MDNRLLLVKSEDKTNLKVPGFYTITQGTDIKYVGSTANLQRRYWGHNGRLKSGKHENKNLQTLSDQNTSLQFNPVPTDTKEEALNIEQQHLDDVNLREGLCNVATDARVPSKGIVRTQEHIDKLAAALRGKARSIETRAKMSTSKMGHKYNVGHKQTSEHKAAISRGTMGHSVSTETRSKLAKAATGNTRALGMKLSDEVKNKLSISKGEPVVIDDITYQSAQFAARQLNLSPQTILNRCASKKFPKWSKDRG